MGTVGVPALVYVVVLSWVRRANPAGFIVTKLLVSDTSLWKTHKKGLNELALFTEGPQHSVIRDILPLQTHSLVHYAFHSTFQPEIGSQSSYVNGQLKTNTKSFLREGLLS